MSASDSTTSPEYPRKKGISGVYEIYCTVNGKRYIGSAQCLRHRRNDHLHLLRTNQHHSIHLQRAWNLYGEAAFVFRVLEYCAIDETLQREQHFIELLHPEFNISRDASSPMKGRKHTEEARQSMSANLRGRPLTEEHKRKISEGHKGKTTSEAHKRSISQTLSGRSLPQEHRDKISKANSGDNNPIRKHPEKAARGEKVNTAKLTAEDVIEIRKQYAQGISAYRLAKLYGVRSSTVERIVLRKSWKHIP